MGVPVLTPPPVVEPAPTAGQPGWRQPIVIIGAVLVALAVTAGAVWASPLRESVLALLGQKAANAARLLPADSPLVIHLAPTGEHLKHIETIRARFEQAPQVKRLLTNVDESLTTGENVSFSADVQPWLGPEIALALTSPDGLTSRDGGTPELILALATRDQRLSDQFLNKLRAGRERRNITVLQKQHRGVTYYAAGGDRYYTTIGGFVILTSTEDALTSTINRAQGQGGPTLAEAPAYQEITRAMPANRVGDIYVAPGAFLAALDRAPAPLAPAAKPGAAKPGRPTDAPPGQLTADQRATLQALRAVGLAVRVESNGLGLDAVTLFDPSKLNAAQQAMLKQGASPLKVLGQLPERTIAFWTTKDLHALWRAASAPLANDPAFSRSLQQFEQATGLNLEQDILSWMNGEVALAVVPDADGFMNDKRTPLGALLVIEVTDRKLVEEKLDKINQALSRQRLSLASREVRGVPMRVLTGPNLPAAGYGFVGDYLVIGTSVTTLGGVVDSKTASVANAPTYRKVSDGLGKERASLLYLDVSAATQLASTTPAAGRAREFEPFFRPIKGIAVGTAPVGADNIHRAQLFILVE